MIPHFNIHLNQGLWRAAQRRSSARHSSLMSLWHRSQDDQGSIDVCRGDTKNLLGHTKTQESDTLHSHTSSLPTSFIWCARLIFMSALFCASSAQAQVPEDPHFGLHVGGHGVRFVGDLSDESLHSAVDVQLEFMFVRAKTLPIRGFVAVEAMFTGATHTQQAFPFAPGEDLAVRAFLFIPQGCWQPTGSLLWCAGIGQGTVNVNGEQERRDYGTWNYQSSLRFFPRDGLSVGVMGKYVGQVEQQVRGEDSAFSFVTLGADVGWWW